MRNALLPILEFKSPRQLAMALEEEDSLRKRSVKDACRRSPPGAMIGAWQRQQRKCPLSA